MPPRKELCRNFQRGSCQYGDRCKFLHATPQQPKPNPFGFGTQADTSPFQRTNQQQMPNPFGFGVQNNTQSRGGNDFGSKPNQFKPFENKWSRFSSPNGVNATGQTPNQQQAVNHKCTEPEACKRMIVADLENEKPLWKITSYGHSLRGPCDIVGDISFEELHALAYDDAKQGKSLQFIIDRERSLVNSKLAEFEKLLQKPYPASTPSTQNLFNLGGANTPVINSGFSTQASSFSQLSASINSGSALGQSGAFGNNSQAFSMFPANNPPFGGSGTFSGQHPQQSVQSSFPFGSTTPGNNTLSSQRNAFSTLANSSQTGNTLDQKPDFVPNVLNPASSVIGQSSIQSANNMTKENTNVDGSIWMKAEWKWNAGEIPEDAPPDIYIHLNW